MGRKEGVDNNAIDLLWCRKVGDAIVPTTRQIRFHLDRVVPEGTYTLRVALAAAHMSRLQVLINLITSNNSLITGSTNYSFIVNLMDRFFRLLRWICRSR